MKIAEASGTPLVSIGLAVYNGAASLAEAIESLLAQDYPNFEIIIADNASTDETPEICRRYRAADARISYHRSDHNRGALVNFNWVFDLAAGEFFTWAAHDDRRAPGHISACVKALLESERVVLAGTACEVRDITSSELLFTDSGFSTPGLAPAARYKLYKTTLHGGHHVGGIFHGVYRRRALAKLMPMPKIIGADNLVMAGLALAGDLVTVPQPWLVKQWGGGSLSHRKNARTISLENPWLIRFPYLVREFYFQQLIRKSDQLDAGGKLGLRLWSWGHYVRLVLRLCAGQCYGLLPKTLKRLVKRLLRR
jgi:glycosyltransferase involved in cell wall biosynthesis